ncbi:hypothetical protein AB1Y20_001402 [Prymnesium parvum]|uniref:Protein kinase domain-containing protein n=1 Tax=Prymnesium parvum TaxID=97485 RepID=A0AB34KBY2_PRYPA
MASSRRKAAERIEREALRRLEHQTNPEPPLASVFAQVGEVRPGIVPGTCSVRPHSARPAAPRPEATRRRDVWAAGAPPPPPFPPPPPLGPACALPPSFPHRVAPPTPPPLPSTPRHDSPAAAAPPPSPPANAPPPPPAAAAPPSPTHRTSPPTPPDERAALFASGPLGAGAFASVRVTRAADGRRVAVKSYDARALAQQPGLQMHLQSEARLAGMLHHPHVIAPREVRRRDGQVEVEMEYASGGTLEEYVASTRVGEGEARRLFSQLVDAVAYLHREQVVHRDIKLENVLLDEARDVKLIDFGASHRGPQPPAMLAGTPAYMAPEVALGHRHDGKPTDVWSLGVLLCNLLGAQPFDGRNMAALRHNIVHQRPRLPCASSAAISLLQKLLHKDPSQRITIEEVQRHPWLRSPPPPTAPAACENRLAAAVAVHAALKAEVLRDCSNIHAQYRMAEEPLHAFHPRDNFPTRIPSRPRTAEGEGAKGALAFEPLSRVEGTARAESKLESMSAAGMPSGGTTPREDQRRHHRRNHHHHHFGFGVRQAW